MTKATKQQDIERAWNLVDVKGKTLGRISSEIAQFLMGKSKPYFVRNLDCGDYVVVLNAKDIVVSGNKELQKQYFNYSGYPGGLRIETLQNLRKRKPTDVIVHAVKGMLPQNKLRDRMLTRLYVFADDQHPYEEKFKSQKSPRLSSGQAKVKKEAIK